MVSNPSAPLPTDRDAQAADEAVRLLRAGQRERAALHLHQRLGNRVQAYLLRHRVPAADAEELVSDVWIKFMQSPCPANTRPVVLLWSVVHSVLVDWVRQRDALKRGGKGQERLQVEVDEDTFELHLNALESNQTPAWLKLCIERAAHALQQADPNRAHVLWLWYRGHTAAEIALVYGAKPPPSAPQESAARSRVLEAMRKARVFFQHCQD